MFNIVDISELKITAGHHNGYCVSSLSVNKLIKDIFHRAKQTREPFSLSDHKSKTMGELGHHDLLPSSVLNVKSPFDLAHERKTNLSHLSPIDDEKDTSIEDGSMKLSFDITDSAQGMYQEGWHYSTHTPGLRRSTRQSKLPVKLNDYVLSSNVKYGIEKYVNYSKLKELLHEYGLLAAKPVDIPFAENIVLSHVETDKDKFLKYFTNYQKHVGKLIYHNHTRPDISYVVHYRSQHMRYLKGSPSLGLQFNKCSNLKLRAYVDADWAKCHKTKKYVSGYCVFLAIQIATNLVFHEKTKHFELDVHIVREKVFLFLNSKCKRYFYNKLKPSKLTWTAMYRKQYKKDIAQEVMKKRPHDTKKSYYRAIVGATLEFIQKKRCGKLEL
nr:60S ribosomal protein L24-like [Tanacetum cinerariifolium]